MLLTRGKGIAKMVTVIRETQQTKLEKGMAEKQYFKTLLDSKMSAYGNHKWRVGKWYACEGKLELCGNGFHASELIQDAIGYVRPGFVCQVEVRGDAVHGDDKSCFREMRILKAYRWTKKDSVALAVFAAEHVLSIARATTYAAARAADAADAADAAAYAARAAYAAAAAYAARADMNLKIHDWIVKRCGF